jgi:diguanylate cyclase (GGDEF)-like protein
MGATSDAAVALQALGVAPFAVLGFVLDRAWSHPCLRPFWRAWAALTGALVVLGLSVSVGVARPWLVPVQLAGEYAFGVLLFAGCRCLSGDRRAGDGTGLLAPAVAVALALAFVVEAEPVRVLVHLAILSLLMAAAWIATRGAHRVRGDRVGVPLLRLSLAGLVAVLLYRVAVLAPAVLEEGSPATASVTAVPLAQLVLVTLLGVATLIVAIERERDSREGARRALGEAREELRTLARLDPLTDSLNRHAFYSMVEEERSPEGAGGCVAVADLDHLKPINDTFGHAAGDAAIRAVASAIRRLVRAADLVFRWGGDEFLVVLFNVSEHEARRRLRGIDDLLASVPVPGSPEPLAVKVSVGVAPFDVVRRLEDAIETAEERMSRAKLARRMSGKEG